ncbi:MAG: glycosyltransferase [Bacteroidales bacterium]|nr:glycosyltransferase [Bacteroidales bacterium]
MKKKILFIMFNLAGGGAEKVLVDILQHFDYNQYDVELALIKRKGVYLSDIPKNVIIRTLFNRFTAQLGFKLLKYFNIHFVNKLIIQHKIKDRYHAIISFMEGYPLVVHSYLAEQAEVNISWVHTDLFTYHRTKHLSIYGDKMEKACYDKMDKLVFVSKDSCSQFDKLFDINVPKTVIYNPIPKDSIIQSANNTHVEKKKFVIGNVARFVEVKKLDRLMRVAKRLKDDHYDIEFWLIGEGVLKNDLIKLQKQLGLEDYVFFKGFKKPAYPYIKQFDLLLITSLTEGFPLVVCEALCLGVPICSTRVTGSIEILDNGNFGILTDHDDDSIYNAVKQLLDNRNQLQYYHEKSLERSAMFDIDKAMEEIYALF